MKESNDQGPANRIGPESCIVARKGDGEALTGVHAGWLSSPEITSRVPTLMWVSGRSHRPARHGKSRPDPAGPPEPMHAWMHLARKPGDPRFGPSQARGPHRESLTGVRR